MPVSLNSKLPKVGTTIFAVMTAKAREAGAIDLSQGFPDFDVPPRLAELLSEAVAAGYNQYPPYIGVPALREAIAAKVAALYGRKAEPQHEITVTTGATEALMCAAQAVIRPGDEAIVFDPAYDAYEPAVELAGGRTVHVLLATPGYGIDWQRLGDAITDRTRLIYLNSPHNPAGATLSHGDLDLLAELIRDRNILLISDEVYEHICFDAAGHASVLAHDELAERAFVISSFGKTYHCTGWKLGYCVAPPALTTELRKAHQYVTFASMAPAQHAVAQFMVEHPEHHIELADFYCAKRDRLNGWLERAGFALTPAAGTYFQVADYSALSDAPDTEFADTLIAQAGVSTIPVSVFFEQPPQGQRHLRFCFAKDDATLDAAGEALCAWSKSRG